MTSKSATGQVTGKHDLFARSGLAGCCSDRPFWIQRQSHVSKVSHIDCFPSSVAWACIMKRFRAVCMYSRSGSVQIACIQDQVQSRLHVFKIRHDERTSVQHGRVLCFSGTHSRGQGGRHTVMMRYMHKLPP